MSFDFEHPDSLYRKTEKTGPTGHEEKKLFRIIAVAKAEFYGIDAEGAKNSFMSQAETLDTDEWTFILVEEIKP